MFEETRLKLARARRGLTAKALAEQAGVSVDTIKRLEKGRNEPEPDTVGKLAGALRYPEEFFFGSKVDSVDPGAVSFRSFSKMTARERDASLGAGSVGLMLSEWVDERFGLPEPELIDLSYESDPEVASAHVRQHWSLGQQPITDLLALLEAKGVRLFSLTENTASVNAFSFWRGGKPYMFLNNFKTAESSRFDAAHELAHLVMHMHGDPKKGRNVEREANAFASAFLMPAEDVIARIPRRITTDVVIRAKARWRVSAMAMAYRLHQLRRLSEWQYKSICIDLTKRGYRTGEPNGISREKSKVWRQVLTMLWQERVTKADIARELGLPLDEVEGLIWSLTADEVAAERQAKGSLRAV
ncbi:ImmA/IrrE family metallo-endopeptidase [Palleronia sediminis]|uniref:ImmA/IrrE family metallo-endopeptidase n=1 Tax=Palleronia sediminis TaxID=2547833 RepID=A0A4R6AMX9_9RHOB|nr:ImmA/IrrE family metallo-endopeptidase [Palleronia sediminis]TDL83908.1 ImmA/IrrE family metallo-endopeptidase [Palleronia sediminis]